MLVGVSRKLCACLWALKSPLADSRFYITSVVKTLIHVINCRRLSQHPRGGLIRQNRPIDPNPQLFVWRHIYRAGISQKFPSCSMFDPMYMGSEVSIEKGPKLLRKSWKNGKSWISSQKKLHLISYFTIATYPIDYNRILKHFGWIKSLACFFWGVKTAKNGVFGLFQV